MKPARVVPATAANIRRAAEVLRRGGVVAFPTETVYGLGADAFNARAVGRVFAIKRRPQFDPLIVHAATPAQAFALWKGPVPRQARRAAEVFWPGPLTLVLPKIARIPDIVTAGLDTVGVRVPSHPTALALIRQTGRPIAAPSANPFGRTSPTTAQMVAEELGDEVDMILDGGPAGVGVESTVLRADGSGFELLRPGGVPLEAVKKIAPVRRPTRAVKKKAFLSPGMLESHYAPKTPLVLVPRISAMLIKKLLKRHPRAKIALLFFKGHSGQTPMAPRAVFEVLSPSGDLVEAAARLFQLMRKLDKMKPAFIVAERVPEKGLGLAISDRLRRASAGNSLKKLAGAHGRAPLQ